MSSPSLTAPLPPVTFAEVWAQEFKPRIDAILAREAELRTDAMLDVGLTLCGEPVRQLTPDDMLQLDALGNPFISGSPDGTIQFIDCAAFVWQLHEHNTHTSSLLNLYRRGRTVQRLARYAAQFDTLHPIARDISAYVDRMLLGRDDSATDAPDAESSAMSLREDKTHFIAPLLVSVAAEIGHIDPLGGRLLAHTPLPRLLQYQRAVFDFKGEARTYTALDSYRVKCQQRVNEINWQRRTAAAPASSPS
jgi:hypothetical protein